MEKNKKQMGLDSAFLLQLTFWFCHLHLACFATATHTHTHGAAVTQVVGQ